MNTKRLFVGPAALPFLVGAAMAGQPAQLSDSQMDQVTAGFTITYNLGPGPFNGCTPVGINCTHVNEILTLSYPVNDGATGLASFPSLKSAPLSVFE